MTSLLVIIVLALLAVAIWQLTKIFDLTQVGNHINTTEVADDNDNNLQGYLMFIFLGFIYIITIVCLVKYGDLPLMSNAASVHGAEVDNLMWISMVLIFIVQIITQGLLHYFSFAYRGINDRKALYFADNDKLEFVWSVIPAIVLAGLILYGLYAWTNIMFIDEDEEVIVVELYAKQFGWEARYSGKDNVLGKANVRFIKGINTVGMDESDPNGQDDFMASEIHLPLGKKVLFKIRSQDVLHSAYMPHFRAQMNCVPGMVTQFAFVPSITTTEMRAKPEMIEKVERINQLRADKSKMLVASGETALDPYTFDYLLLCNKICGTSHYNMQMKIVIDTPEDYKEWLKDKATLSSKIKEEGMAKEATVETAVVAADETMMSAK